MSNNRDDHLAQKLNEFLDRFSPPRRIANNPSAMQQDADEMMRILLRFAPPDDYIRWIDNVLRDLQEGMTTRSWPAPGELARACKANATTGQQHRNAAHVESCMVDKMATWHAKFGAEMPSMGKPERTAELIRRGVLSSERSARFFGYALSTEQALLADEQPTTHEEWRHHVRVTARLRGISEFEAEAALRKEPRSAMDRSTATIPDKSTKPMAAH